MNKNSNSPADCWPNRPYMATASKYPQHPKDDDNQDIDYEVELEFSTLFYIRLWFFDEIAHEIIFGVRHSDLEI